MLRPFRQVDVFTTTPYLGNPVAVVLDGTGLSTGEMQRFAAWTNLSETTFVLPRTTPEADYGVRIFTPVMEVPFAGHPTLGTCHAWLETGGVPRQPDVVVQECGAGLVRVRRSGEQLAFSAPALRTGPVEDAVVERVASALGIDRPAILDSQWLDNGLAWVGVVLGSAEEVLALRPQRVDLDIGVVGAHPAGGRHAFEVRAFFPKDGSTVEDPVTGSLNASLAEWLLRTGRATLPYTATQGSALGRAGIVEVSGDADETIWVGGGTVTCLTGQVGL